MGEYLVVLGISILLISLTLLFRAIFLIATICITDCKLDKKAKVLKTLICIGSGGHTSELLRLTRSLNKEKYQPRLYILANNDVSSEVKITEVEKVIGDGKYSISKIPRSRNVHQTFLSSFLTTLYAIISTMPTIYNFKPDVIFCNGPGTCVPICLVSFLFRCLWLVDCRIVFIESICRVRTMSLTGNILKYFADIVVVQWPLLRDVCSRAKYFGRLT